MLKIIRSSCSCTGFRKGRKSSSDDSDDKNKDSEPSAGFGDFKMKDIKKQNKAYEDTLIDPTVPKIMLQTTKRDNKTNFEDSFMQYLDYLKNPTNYKNDSISRMLSQFDQISKQILTPIIPLKDITFSTQQKELKGGYGSIRKGKIIVINYQFKKEKLYYQKERIHVAAKTLVKQEDSFGIKAFMNEITVLKACNHKNIISFKAIVFDPQNFYLITEWCNGSDLFNFLYEDKTRWESSKVQDLLDIGIDIATGLDYLHKNDIIHRDIKSANILLYTERGSRICAKIADFGLAYSLTHGFEYFNRSKIAMSMHAGTPRWMAPEIQSNFYNINIYRSNIERYTAKIDIYAFGIVLSEIASGLPPYWNSDKDFVKYSIESGILNLNELNSRSDMPDSLIELIWDCTEFDRFSRPNSNEVLNRIQNIREQTGNKKIVNEKKRVLVRRPIFV